MSKYAYTSSRVIDHGGFGRVDEVWSAAGNGPFARKTFDSAPELGATDQKAIDKLRKRFEREVRVQKQCEKLGAFPIIESNLEDDPPWYVMPARASMRAQ